MGSRETSDFPSSRDAPPFRLGEWRVEPSLNRLRRDDAVVQLEPRIMQVLVCLASRPGRVLGRDALLEAVWGDTVVCEDALTRAVSDLRRAFEDDPLRPRFIETIRKGGYRLVAPVEAVADGGVVQAGPPNVTTVRGRRPGTLALIAGLAALALLAVAIRQAARRPGAPPPPASRPLTAFPGRELDPALSPDGTRLAYVRDGGHGTGLDVWVQQVDAGAPVRLTTHPGDERCPAWSPDAVRLAYLRGEGREGLFVIPALGGTPRRLHAGGFAAGGLDWFPDGRALAAVAGGPDSATAILWIPLDGTAARRLGAPPARSRGDRWPAVAPDGERLAFVRADEAGQDDLYLAPVDGGPARRLTAQRQTIAGIDWLPGGRALVLSRREGGSYGLYRLEPDRGEPAWLPIRSRSAQQPSVAADGSRLAFADASHDLDVHRLRLTAAGELTGGPEPLIDSTRDDYAACPSPDGARIAYLSRRSGHLEVWICDADGGHPWQLTELRGPQVLAPCFAPGGERIAFSVLVDDRFVLFVADLAAAAPRRLDTGPEHAVAAFWSRDGSWIHFRRGGEGGWRLCRIPPEGGGVEDVLPPGAETPCLSPDGGLVYYVSAADGGIWSRPAAGGEPRPVLPAELGVTYQRLAAAAGALFLVRRTAEIRAIERLDLASGAVARLWTTDFGASTRFAVSDDGRTLLLDRGRLESDIVLVEGPF